MRVQITTNAPEVANGIRAVFRDQIPFALAVSTNALANRVQERQRRHHTDVFDIRRPRWSDRTVKRRSGEDWATKADPTAVVRYESPGGGGREDILTKFENDRFKGPFSSRFLWVPIDVPRKDPKWRISRLDLKPQPRARRSRVGREGRRTRQAKVLVGKRNTFAIIYGGSRQSFIFERDYDELTLLYASKPRVPIEPVLNFEENAREVVAARADEEFRRAFDRAIGAAR